jgi:hypothetical protein
MTDYTVLFEEFVDSLINMDMTPEESEETDLGDVLEKINAILARLMPEKEKLVTMIDGYVNSPSTSDVGALVSQYEMVKSMQKEITSLYDKEEKRIDQIMTNVKLTKPGSDS